MIRRVLLALVAAVALLLAYAATRPDSFRIERSVLIQAPPEKVFALIDRFPAWEAWSPWEKVDPALKRTYGGAERGPGATYAWEGNDEVGVGNMTIASVEAPGNVTIRLEFTKPFPAVNTVTFTLVPESGGSRVTQAMFGPSPYLSKVMGLFFSMDEMVGGRFEEGLGNLKRLAEQS